MKAAADGHFWPFLWKSIPDLGAPFGAVWDDFPMTEDFLFLFWGVLAKISGSTFGGVALGQMFGAVFSALSFFLVCRWMRWRPAPTSFG